MINKLILKQLEQVQEADVGEYDKLHHTFHIKKKKEQIFEYNTMYLVKLDKHLLNATDNDILVSNWNNGNYPKHEYLKFAISKKVAKMLYVYGYYYDIENECDMAEDFEGWLPQEQLQVIKEMKI